MVQLLCTFVIKNTSSSQALFTILSCVLFSCSYVVLMDADHCGSPVYHFVLSEQ